MKDLRDMLIIARRELYERVQSKWFVAMTLLGPILMIGMIVLPALIAGRSTAGTRVDLVDRTPGQALAPALAAQLELLRWQVTIAPPDTPDDAGEARIRAGQINGYLVVGARVLERDAGAGAGRGAPESRVVYRGDNASNQAVQLVLDRVVRDLVRARRAELAGLTPDQREAVLREVWFAAEHTTGDKDASSGSGAFFVAYILAFVLYMVITLYGVAVMRSVVQEKSSRVMELMVAAVKPRALMGGKILGVGGAGLIQVGAWLTMGALMLAYREELLGLFGITGGGRALPALAPGEVAIVLLFFIGGYFFYAAMYAAVGAMVSSEQETQQVQLPVTMMLVIGLLCFQLVVADPRGSAAAAMTLVPFWSPILMPMRFLLGGASVAEVALSLGILAASIALAVRAAGKIYRVGVLMYGKRPTARELWRWLRY